MAVLKLKSKGKDVEALQKALNKQIKSNLEPDGIFGKGTKAALIKFQKKNSLKPDGIAGSSTLAVLGLGPSLKFAKMKVKDLKGELKFYKSKASLQGVGGPDQMASEMIVIKKLLVQREKKFLAMVTEVKNIQKDVENQHKQTLHLLTEIASTQKDYALAVKNNNVEDAALRVGVADILFSEFKKHESWLLSYQDDQETIFLGKFDALIKKTFE